MKPIRHRPGSRALRAAEPKREFAGRDDCEGETHLPLHCETQVSRVEGGRGVDVPDEVANDRIALSI
jgi:hypothetical protein